MNWNPIPRFLKGLSVEAGARFVLPRIVLEIEPDFVLGGRLDRRSRSLRRLGVRELAPHTLEPVAHGTNLANGADFSRALQGVREVVENGNGRVGVLLPDAAVRVVVLSFETLPSDPQEAEDLIRWRLKDSLAGSPEEVKMSYQALEQRQGHVELLVAAVSRSVLAEYLGGLGPMNGGPALVLPSSLALVPLLGGEGPGELLVHVCSGWMTTVVHEGGRIRSWRSRHVQRGTAEDLGREVIQETGRVLASAGDRLKVDVQRVRLCLRPRPDKALDSELAQAVSKEVTRLVPDTRWAALLSEGEQELFRNLAAPLVGVASNAE